MFFASIPEAVTSLQEGKMLIVIDNPQRENQADVIFPAATVTKEKVSFLMRECRGMFCVAMRKDHAAKLNIPPMIPLDQNTEPFQCNFGITVDAKHLMDSGISASDRTVTTKLLSDTTTKPTDLIRPGHVSPLIAVDGGVLERPGHTEAAVDLARLAGFTPVGVLSEIICDDGRVAKLPDLLNFSSHYDLKVITIDQLIEYLKKT